ncbi:ABC transporter substrate-binding protein [Leucobacter triazinivorans]|uniref:ABC transporter substrate-binding protein n=1 Tax=Leucobacter triazinivorans TaxID=1784719 RepID=A0A4P6KHN6_9MICO|nr:ABC transporter substrate-binding protein [Leucobacter triazinivorans]QBE50065.1 ABC transporter substrate-binding protein [Leucobacter triazinivorans]
MSPLSPDRARRRPARAAAAALGAALLLSACSSGGGASGAGGASADSTPEITTSLPAATGQAERVSWALYNEPSSLDPIKISDFPIQQVVTNVCESLLKLTPDMTIVPNLAESWENPEPTVWVYHLRDGVTFHNGGTMTAEDVVYSMQRAADYDLGSMVAGAYDPVESIEATGPLEVTVTLKQPDVTFHQEMATSTGRVFSKAVTEAQGEQVGTPNAHVDCTGPYRIGEWKAGEHITIERFDDYWDGEHLAQTDEVRFTFVRDSAARVNGMLSGEIQGSWNVPPSGFAKLSRTDQGGLFFGETSGAFIAWVSSLEGGLKDQRVRQALSMAIDREGIIKAAMSGAADPLYTVASSGTWGYAKERFQEASDEIAALPRSVEEAKRLVAEAGPQPPIVLATTSSQPEMPIVAAEIQRAGKEIGLEVDIKTLPEDTYNSLYGDAEARKGIDMIFTTWQTYYPDPISLYVFLQSDNFYNYAQWKNEEFDELVATARQTADEDERAELLIQAQRIAYDDPTWIPVFQPYNPVYVGAGLTGVPTAAIQHNVPWAQGLGVGDAVAGE